MIQTQFNSSPSTKTKRTLAKLPAEKVFTKTFTTGGSQALRLPKAFRFNSSLIQIERNTAGQVVLTEVDENAEAKRLQSLQALFDEIRNNPLTDDEDGFVMPPRELADFRTPFEKIAGSPPLTFASQTPQTLNTAPRTPTIAAS